jgi:hypothetical protein
MTTTEDLDLAMAVGEWVTTTAHKLMDHGMPEDTAARLAVAQLPEALDKAACVITALVLNPDPA